jgi:hypothetical protein
MCDSIAQRHRIFDTGLQKGWTIIWEYILQKAADDNVVVVCTAGNYPTNSNAVRNPSVSSIKSKVGNALGVENANFEPRSFSLLPLLTFRQALVASVLII